MSRSRTLWLGWLLALACIASFTRLGFWQLERMHGKQAMLDRAAQVLRAPVPKPLAAAADPVRAQTHDWAAGSGTFDARGPLWLDNQQRNGRVGVRAYRIFLPALGGPLLVDLGWLPLPGDRTLPAIARPQGTLELHGLLAPPPSPGIALGPGIVRNGEGWLLTRLDPGSITRAAGLSTPLAARVLRLNPSLPIGYERDLALLANTLPPARHRGYAVQWFALALAALGTALILTFRKRRR